MRNAGRLARVGSGGAVSEEDEDEYENDEENEEGDEEEYEYEAWRACRSRCRALRWSLR